MLIAMTIAAALCIGIGSYPAVLYQMLPFEVDYTAYDATHVLAQLQLLFFSALAFAWLNLRGMYPPELRSTNLDFEWVYRRLAPCGWGFLNNIYAAIRNRIEIMIAGLVAMLLPTAEKFFSTNGLLSRQVAIGNMVIACLLIFLLLLWL
ncbi:MAG: hypothetical protein WD601_06875 [Pseudohongiellaceae bacterium]